VPRLCLDGYSSKISPLRYYAEGFEAQNAKLHPQFSHFSHPGLRHEVSISTTAAISAMQADVFIRNRSAGASKRRKQTNESKEM